MWWGRWRVREYRNCAQEWRATCLGHAVVAIVWCLVAWLV